MASNFILHLILFHHIIFAVNIGVSIEWKLQRSGYVLFILTITIYAWVSGVYYSRCIYIMKANDYKNTMNLISNIVAMVAVRNCVITGKTQWQRRLLLSASCMCMVSATFLCRQMQLKTDQWEKDHSHLYSNYCFRPRRFPNTSRNFIQAQRLLFKLCFVVILQYVHLMVHYFLVKPWEQGV